MSLYHQFGNYPNLSTPTAFDSPLTLSPFNTSSDDCIDHLTTIDLSAINSPAPTSTSTTFTLNPTSVERILHFPQFSPITPPDRSLSTPQSTSTSSRPTSASILSSCKMNSITTSVIVPNSSLTSSTTATMSKSIEGKAKLSSSSTATSSTVSTIVMQSSNSSSGSSNSSSNASHSQQCLVCGDIPLGRNFGILTCGSCKIFFRRNNPDKPEKIKLQCRNNNHCAITKGNRRNCAACRLKKCIDLGMRVKQNKQSKVKSAEQHDESSNDKLGLAAEENGTNRHSHSSTSEDDDAGYEDLPSLIPFEEVQNRLQTQVEQSNRNDVNDALLDDVQSVILSHISDEQQHTSNGQLEQLTSLIESNLQPSDDNVALLRNSTKEIFSTHVGKLLLPTELSPLTATSTSSTSLTTSSIGAHNNETVSSSVDNYVSSSFITEPESNIEQLEANTLVTNAEDGEEEAQEAVSDGEDDQFTNMPSDGQLTSFVAEEQPNYESSSSDAMHQVQPCTHDTVYLEGPGGSCAIDLDSPECIAHAKHMRLMHFYDQQQPPILGCGFQNFQMYDPQPISFDGFNHSFTYRQRSSDEGDENEYYIHDGNSLLHQRQKRMHEGDYETGLELVKTEAKNLGSRVHNQISELCKLTSLIRIKLGIEYKTGDLPEYQLFNKEMEKINILNGACRMIDIKPSTSTQLCTRHVYDSLKHGIFYANKTFKIFEEFWHQNSEMRELIRQDETGFDRKRNNLLHMLYHLRGVYNFDESQNAWAVLNGTNENTLTYIKLTMFNESVKKEMTLKHHQYIQSFPKDWRQDPTVFNLMTFLLIFGAFEEMHSQFKCEKIRYFKLLYLVRRYLEQHYQDPAKALQMLNHMLKLIGDLEPLCSDCLTACTHSLTPQVLQKIGPNYAACLMLEMQKNKRDEEERRKRKHSRHSESSDVSSRDKELCDIQEIL